MQAVFGPGAAWSTTDHLLAGMLDAERIAIWQRSADRKIPRPQPIPRPGDEAERRTELSPAERHHRLLELRARTAKEEVTNDS